MASGCKNPSAMNYDPAANPDDYSCVYLLKNQGNCHWFEDAILTEDTNKSFTLSQTLNSGWVFFHDFYPDIYFHTRISLYNTKNSQVYKHNEGPAGHYHEGTGVKPFFIDVVFQTEKNMLLENISWMTDFLDGQTAQPFQTLTHISIWNSHQHAGRIALSTLQPFKNFTARSTKGEWVLKDFRNLLLNKGEQFLLDIFHDYAVVADQMDVAQAWYKKELLRDKWFCVRFEFDNSVDAKVILHNTNIQALKSDR